MVVPEQGRSAGSPRAGGRWRWLRWVAAVALVALLVGEGVYLWPRLHESWRALTEIHWGWAAACVVMQAISLSAFARVQKQLLRAGGVRVSQRRSLSVIYGSTAMALTLPAGQVFSTAFTYRETRRWGASPVVASWQLAISGVIAALGLAVLGVTGAFLVGGSANTLALIVPVAGVIALIAGVRYVRSHPQSIVGIGRWGLSKYNSLRNNDPDTGMARLDEIVEQVKSVRLGARDGTVSLGFSAVHRLADVACLGFACYAIGADPKIYGLLIAFSASKTVGSIPGAPGGLVIVDATLIATLTTAASISASQAVASALVYRLVSFILVALVGWVVFLILFRKHQHEDLHFDLAVEQRERTELRERTEQPSATHPLGNESPPRE
ncbi:lysylphosphatidylglycerol synthase transmembrane domain-containing protein [Rhodococcus sp. NBC_00297]|uniref:lysylphosphatidylglycerol synthase transmembrane domain-containing protein n=1 Tax=Rhodococcus sp. NBC_00297 TaxID=2976005 RepID=UPI002E2D4B54|nr:YbhN family protein [Rhodococcus sp. NBC_00297]